MAASRVVRWIGYGALALLAAQLIRPARTNPPVDPAKTVRAVTHITEDEARILDRACRDCHSTETRWPWYSNVAPMSWFVINHVDDGRHALSFSDWADMPARLRADRPKQICDDVTNDRMPLWSYLLVHHDAKLSADDKAAICAWTERERAAR